MPPLTWISQRRARGMAAYPDRWDPSRPPAKTSLSQEVEFLLRLCDNHRAMFSLQALFGKGDRFFQLLEAAAAEAHESVQHLIQLLKAPENPTNLDDLVLSRRKEKKIAEQISSELVRTFVTALEREDIEALSHALYKIPKAVEKFAERFHVATEKIRDFDFGRQAVMMEKATNVVLDMVRQLRD